MNDGRSRAISFLRQLTILVAASLALVKGAHAERLPVRTYTSADGLGSSYVSFMMRDSHGFMWFCTRDGLSRFDGSRFVTYQIGDKNSPPGVEQILETRKGIYWIVTTGGLYRYDPNAPPVNNSSNADRWTLNAELVSAERGVLYEDRSGNLWSGSYKLFRVEEKDGKVFMRDAELNPPVNTSTEFNIIAICEGRDGSLWLATIWGLARRLPDGRTIFYSVESPLTDAIGSVLEDRAGRIWFASGSGVYILNPESLDEPAQPGAPTVHKLADLAQLQSEAQVRLPERPGEIYKYTDLKGFAPSNIKYLYQTSDSHLWISAGDGVIEFDGQRFIPHTSAQGLMKGVGLMVEDTSGNLWMGWLTGLMRLDRKGLTAYGETDGLRNPAILSVNESVDGRLHVFSNGFFLSRFDGQGFQTIRPQVPTGARSVWTSNALLQDHSSGGSRQAISSIALPPQRASAHWQDSLRWRPIQAATG